MTALGISFSGKIVVRMPNWIGDLVMATPVLADLRKAFPKAHITAMCGSSFSDLLKYDPHIDEIFSFSKPSNFGRREKKRDIIEKLRQGKYDVGILLTHSFSSAWWFTRGNVKRRIGYCCNLRSLLLTDRLVFPKNIQEQHLVTTYKILLAPLGIPVSNTSPKIYLKQEEIEEASSVLREMGITKDTCLIGINPGATYGSAKCWLPERFSEVTEHLLKRKNTKILYFGSASTTPLVKQICQTFPSDHVINLAGLTSIRELSCFIKLCTVLLTNDSGPMHIAAALGVPLVALFGSTSDIITGPYQTGVVIHKHVSCSPCYRRVCPIDFRCMKQIESQEVIEEIKRIIEKCPL